MNNVRNTIQAWKQLLLNSKQDGYVFNEITQIWRQILILVILSYNETLHQLRALSFTILASEKNKTFISDKVVHFQRPFCIQLVWDIVNVTVDLNWGTQVPTMKICTIEFSPIFSMSTPLFIWCHFSRSWCTGIKCTMGNMQASVAYLRCAFQMCTFPEVRHAGCALDITKLSFKVQEWHLGAKLLNSLQKITRIWRQLSYCTCLNHLRVIAPSP